MDNPMKVYVGVQAYFEPDGRLFPQTVIWEDGRSFPVDRVLDIRPAASLKAGGCGLRYKVRICHQETYLFLEEGKWFVERRGNEGSSGGMDLSC